MDKLIMAHLSPKIKPQKHYHHKPLPPGLVHMQAVVDRLPWHIVVNVILQATTGGLSDAAIDESLRAAVKFQEQRSWRCASCMRWVTTPNLILVCLVPESDKIEFHMYCPRCEAKHGNSTDAVRKAVAPYVVGEEWER
jgi:hypothetical protein